jgi:hypothetical protein
MSRFKKKLRNKHREVPTSAAPTQSQPAPGMPTEPELEQQLHQRIEKARAELYKLRNGEFIDQSIARWQRMLRIYDREAEALEATPPEKQHRWTISPSMALRAETRLEKLLAQQEQLLDECHAEAAKIVKTIYERQMKGDPLCPPKQTPATGAESEAVMDGPATEGGRAESPPIAA